MALSTGPASASTVLPRLPLRESPPFLPARFRDPELHRTIYRPDTEGPMVTVSGMWVGAVRWDGPRGPAGAGGAGQCVR